MDQTILNAFLFSAFAGGVRFTDCVLMQYRNIMVEHHRYYLNYTMHKTKKEIRIPLSQTALNIIQPLNENSEVLLFKILSDNFKSLRQR